MVDSIYGPFDRKHNKWMLYVVTDSMHIIQDLHKFYSISVTKCFITRTFPHVHNQTIFSLWYVTKREKKRCSHTLQNAMQTACQYVLQLVQQWSED
jgi:hypothetical protein